MKRFLLLIFLVCCAANILFEWNNYQIGIYISKPLLMPLLLAWFYAANATHWSAFYQWIAIGFVFSFGGDTLLMFVENDPPRAAFFLYGLISFLFAHLCYLVTFWKYTPTQKGLVEQQPAWLIAFAVVLVGNILILWPGLPQALQMPVGIYSSVIVLMGVSALNLYKKIPKRAARTIFWGALLFILSDSLIGLNKFRSDAFTIPYVRVLIMLFYLAGQYLIAKGASLFSESPYQ